MSSLTSRLKIVLGDDEFDLVPSLKAATAISNRFNGFQNALNAVQAADLASVQYVLRQGISLKRVSSETLNEAVWSNGIFKSMKPALEFITLLMNGGREATEDDDGGTSDADEGASGNDEV